MQGNSTLWPKSIQLWARKSCNKIISKLAGLFTLWIDIEKRVRSLERGTYAVL